MLSFEEFYKQWIARQAPPRAATGTDPNEANRITSEWNDVSGRYGAAQKSIQDAQNWLNQVAQTGNMQAIQAAQQHYNNKVNEWRPINDEYWNKKTQFTSIAPYTPAQQVDANQQQQSALAEWRAQNPAPAPAQQPAIKTPSAIPTWTTKNPADNAIKAKSIGKIGKPVGTLTPQLASWQTNHNILPPSFQTADRAIDKNRWGALSGQWWESKDKYGQANKAFKNTGLANRTVTPAKPPVKPVTPVGNGIPSMELKRPAVGAPVTIPIKKPTALTR